MLFVGSGHITLTSLVSKSSNLLTRVVHFCAQVISARQALERCATTYFKQLEQVKLTAQQREDDLLRDHHSACEDFTARLQQANVLIGQYRTLVANMHHAYASGLEKFESDVSQILAQHEDLMQTNVKSRRICCSGQVVSLK
ncbi:hypothetical protein EG68_08665 [Paragonimus skrjabini miyazakii]|uniref:Uncharacterized protein n=1 Tax=Paragonimus skrjabini miyazakii TaxID=59628 RepID=A0A8S9Y8T6_9TREM|nr:hypothetical protein EG68_08665 [Paragonimus skrjabini miyazakii]